MSDMNGSTPNDSVIRKIQLLFQMAQRKTNNDGSSNEAEALSAMAKAQELLTKYNLDLHVVQGTTVERGAAEIEQKREKQQFARTAMYRWQQSLAKAICKANFCFHWVVETTDEWQITGGMRKKHDHPRKVKRHVILGKTANAKVAELMYEYLVDTVERSIPYTGSERLSRSANSWREGCAERLIERIKEKAERMKQAAAGATEEEKSTALAVQDLHEKEYAANYDAQYGAGAYARNKAQEAKWQQQWADERKRREEEHAAMLAGETPKERAAREKKESREAGKQAARDAKYWDRFYAKQEREEARRDIAAYTRGHKKGGEINLDSQVNGGSENKRLK